MKSFINFLPPWVETNIQPAFYDKESGTCLQQTARMYAKVNQLIRKFNELSEEVQNYIKQFIDLKDFVDNYFDNLDVQKEINNKLDAMVEDGTMAEIINQEIFGDLLAEIGDTHNPIHYGADPTGVEDSTQAINDCIQANKGDTITFTTGTYAVSGSINLPFENDEKVSIDGNGAKLVVTGTIEHLFFVGYDRENESDRNDVGFPSFIKDIDVDCSGATVENSIYTVRGYKDLRVDNCTFFRVKNGMLIGETAGSPADILVTNSLFYGKGSEYEGTGFICNGSDNYFSNLRVYGFRKGFEINTYSTIETTQVLLRWAEQTGDNPNPYPIGGVLFNEYYPQTMFADVNSSVRIVTCYADSVYKFLDISTSSHVMLLNSFYFNSRSGLDQHVVDCSSTSPKLTISNNVFTLHSGDSVTMLRCTDESGRFTDYSQLTINGIEIVGIANLTNPNDLMLVGYTVEQHNSVTLNDTDWIIVKSFVNIPTAYYQADIILNISGVGYNIHIDKQAKASDCTWYQYNGSNTKSNFDFAIVEDGDVNYLCIKRHAGASDFVVAFDAMLIASTKLAYLINPVKGDSSYNSSRLLSDYSDKTPVLNLNLNTMANRNNAS